MDLFHILANLEFGILDFIQSHLRNGVLDFMMPLITKLGDGGILWISLTIILLLFRKTRKAGAAMAISLIMGAVCLLLKPLIGRVRPCDVNPAVQLLISRPSDPSFPSGHTGSSFAAAFALFFGKNRLWIPAVILAALIGFTRLYLYVHYPSDVLAGALLGILLGWLGNALTNKAWRYFNAHRNAAT